MLVLQPSFLVLMSVCGGWDQIIIGLRMKLNGTPAGKNGLADDKKYTQVHYITEFAILLFNACFCCVVLAASHEPRFGVREPSTRVRRDSVAVLLAQPRAYAHCHRLQKSSTVEAIETSAFKCFVGFRMIAAAKEEEAAAVAAKPLVSSSVARVLFSEAPAPVVRQQPASMLVADDD